MQDITGNGNRTAGGTYNENVIVQLGDDEYPIVSNLPKKVPYEFEFIGRRREIEDIISIVTGGKGGYKLSIEGVGGLGKTTLAYETARLMQESGKTKYILWFTAKTEDFNESVESFSGNFHNLSSFLKEAIMLLGFKDDLSNVPIDDLKKIFKQLLARQAREKILIVLDNLETVQDSHFFEFIKEMQLIPGDFYLLITSRNNLFLYNENCVILSPLGDEEMRVIIENFKKSFRIPKLSLDINVLIDFCSGNPLIARIIVQKMKYMSGERIYKDYIQPNQIKGAEILDYIFKNTYDALNESTQIFLLLLAHYDNIEDFLLREIEKNIRDNIDTNFSIHTSLENELRKTFFVKYELSDVSIYGIQNLRLEDFVEFFLNTKQTDRAVKLHALLDTEMKKLNQRIGRYKQIAEDFGSKSQIDSMVIVEVIDYENELKGGMKNKIEVIESLKALEQMHPNIPYITLVIARIYKNYFNDKLNESILYGEKALQKARKLLGDGDKIKHYMHLLRGLYVHGKFYDKGYEINKELVKYNLADIEVYHSIMVHELNIGQIERAFESGTKGWLFISNDFKRQFSENRFKIATFLITYYKSAVSVGDIEIMRLIRGLILDNKVPFEDRYGDLSSQYDKSEKYNQEQGSERFKVKQTISIYKTRLKKGFIEKKDYIDYLNSELEKDTENSLIYYELYRVTNNPDHLFTAYKYNNHDTRILADICAELTKYGGEKIGDLLEYAEAGINLDQGSIGFYGYKGLYYLNRRQFEEAINAFKKGLENYSQLSLSQQNNTKNKDYLREIQKYLEIANKKKDGNY